MSALEQIWMLIGWTGVFVLLGAIVCVSLVMLVVSARARHASALDGSVARFATLDLATARSNAVFALAREMNGEGNAADSIRFKRPSEPPGVERRHGRKT